MNEIENAIRHLKVGNFTGKQLDLAISALEKQVPKKPIVGKYDYLLEQIEIKCPTCSGMVGINNGDEIDILFNFCPDCGQKLDREV